MKPINPGLDIRPGMDVYSAYQDQYIGVVTRVFRRPHQDGSPAEHGATPRQTGSSPEAYEDNPHIVHEQGSTVSPTRHTGEKRLGEEMGPVPTMAAGNTGPILQSGEHAYATEPENPDADVAYFAVRPGRINLGIFTRPFYVPTEAVESVSMERVVLDVERDTFPLEWRRRPR